MIGRPGIPGLPGLHSRGRSSRQWPIAVNRVAPTAHWRFHDLAANPATTTAVDDRGSHNGTITGGVVSAASLIAGDPNACFDFNGSTGRVDVNYHANLNAPTFSVWAWIMRDVDTGGVETIMESRTAAGTNGWTFRIAATDKLELGLADGTMSLTAGTTSLAAATRYHVAATYNGTTARVYINGVQDAAGPDVLVANASGGLKIGCNYLNASFFNGKIDEPAYLGGVVLSADAIRTLYRAGI